MRISDWSSDVCSSDLKWQNSANLRDLDARDLIDPLLIEHRFALKWRRTASDGNHHEDKEKPRHLHGGGIGFPWAAGLAVAQFAVATEHLISMSDDVAQIFGAAVWDVSADKHGSVADFAFEAGVIPTFCDSIIIAAELPVRKSTRLNYRH